MDPGEQRRIAKLLKKIDDTESWLEVEVSRAASSAKAKEFAETLRHYLQHCRRQIWAGNNSESAMDRRERKIEEAYFALWEIVRSRN